MRHTLTSNIGRTLLTLLGIMIGTGSIVLLASLLTGGEEALLNSDQDATGNDVVQVDADEAPVKQAQKTRRELGRADSQVLDGSPVLPGAHVASEKDRWTRVYYGKEKKRIALTGVEPVALSLHRLGVAKGRFITPDDVTRGDRVAVIGANVARELFPDGDALGKAVTVDKSQWTVVGVLVPKPGLGGEDGPWMWNSKVLVPRSTFDAVFDTNHAVDSIFVRIGDSSMPLPMRVELARKSIEATVS
ncbi:MAG TPA: ABC transporter permease, partial [Polyangia bacterium]|nr:ABC transporter permease [Polyangia bacterium]